MGIQILISDTWKKMGVKVALAGLVSGVIFILITGSRTTLFRNYYDFLVFILSMLIPLIIGYLGSKALSTENPAHIKVGAIRGAIFGFFFSLPYNINSIFVSFNNNVMQPETIRWVGNYSGRWLEVLLSFLIITTLYLLFFIIYYILQAAIFGGIGGLLYKIKRKFLT